MYAAPDDYMASSTVVEFSSESYDQPFCTTISVCLDDVLENTEFFSVVLYTTDPDVTFTDTSIPVSVFDSSSESIVM